MAAEPGGGAEGSERHRGGSPSRLLRAPLLHFLLVGGLAFALLPAPRPVIVLDAGAVEALRRSWSAQQGRLPTPSEQAALTQQLLDDEILLREAWSRGVPDRDPVVAERLERIGRFVSQHDDGEELDRPEVIAHAEELGLEREDIVIRRYLTTMMRLAIAREADRHLPTQAELEAHLREHARRFARPARVRLTHVFVSSRHGDAAEERARDLLAELASLPAEAAGSRGDPFPTGQRVLATRQQLEREFGAGFAASVEALEAGVWHGPIPSAYGLHLVWIHERVPERPPSLDEVRSQVVHHFQRTRRAEHLQRRLRELRERYEVRVEAGPASSRRAPRSARSDSVLA